MPGLDDGTFDVVEIFSRGHLEETRGSSKCEDQRRACPGSPSGDPAAQGRDGLQPTAPAASTSSNPSR